MVSLSTLKGWIYGFCTGALLTAAATLGAQPTLRITPEAVSAAPGEEIAIDLVLDDFEDVLYFQIPIAWDAGILEFVSVTNINTAVFPGYNADNFGTPENGLAPGQLSTMWVENDVIVPDGTIVFTLNLQVVGEGVTTLAVDSGFGIDFFLLDGREEPIPVTSVPSTVMVSGEAAPCRERDSLALVELYNSTNGPGWTNTWDLNTPMETWFGVTLNENGCVSCLDMHVEPDCFTTPYEEGNNLSGTLPAEIGNLSQLRSLSLSNNNLEGEIPSEMGNLEQIEIIYLFKNNLSGPIPASLFQIESLVELELNYNNLTGSIPADFQSLVNLKQLLLDKNQLSGPVPDFSGLSNLEILDLSENDFSGSVPDFQSLPQLDFLDIAANKLTGMIPDFTGLPQLRGLYLDHNELTGAIPNFQNIPNLDTFRIDVNQLSGPVPDFTNIPNLKRLDADSNRINGPLPDFSNLSNLVFLDFFNNELTGSIPDFSNLLALEELYLDNNDLSGPIPDFSDLPNLRVLDLGGNNGLTGVIPDFTNLPQLERLDLTVTKLKADIPLLSNCPLLNDLEVERNRLTFENILPNFGVLNDRITQNAVDTNDVFLYSPQDPIYPDTLFTRPAGEAFSIDLGIDAGVSTNIYTWYKDGAPYRTVTGNNQLTFDPLSAADAGVYTVEVTNPGAPELTLESGAITIELSPAIRLIAGEASGNPGDEVLLPILAENAGGLAALQGKISFRQPGIAEVLGVEPARLQPVLNIADGQFNFFDGSGLGLTLEPLDTLFYLRLRLIGARGSTSEVFFEDGENFELSAYLFDGDIVEADIETVEGLVTVLEAVSISGRIALYNDRPVAGVTVTAAIEQPNGQRVEQQEVTDANGNYRFAEVPLGSRVRLEPARTGDNAAPINSSGLLYALQALLDGTPAPTLTSPLQLAAADVNCNGNLTTNDLRIIQEVMTGLRPALPDCPVWTFTPESRLPDFRLEAGYFPGFPIPGRRIISNLSGEATINFAGIKTGDVMGEAQTP